MIDQCLAHSGVIQKIKEHSKMIDKHDVEINSIKRSIYIASGSMIVITPIATAYLQHVFK